MEKSNADREISAPTTLIENMQHDDVDAADNNLDSLNHFYASKEPHVQDAVQRHPFWKLIQRPSFANPFTIWKMACVMLAGIPSAMIAPPAAPIKPLVAVICIVLWATFAGIYLWWDNKKAHQKFSNSVAALDLLSGRAAIVERFVENLSGEFSPAVYSVTPGGGSFIAIDENLLLLRICKFDFDKSPEGEIWASEDIPVQEILKSSVSVNGEAVSIAGAQMAMNGIIGGVLAGGAGAVVGAMMGMQGAGIKVVHSIKLELLVNDVRRSKVQFDFLTHSITSPPTIFEISLESIFAKAEAEKIQNAIFVLQARCT